MTGKGNSIFQPPFLDIVPPPHAVPPAKSSAVSEYPHPLCTNTLPLLYFGFEFCRLLFFSPAVPRRKCIDSDQSVSSRGSEQPTDVLISQFCMQIRSCILANWQPISVSMFDSPTERIKSLHHPLGLVSISYRLPR